MTAAFQELHFQWRRFWAPRNEQFDLSDDGFLRDPESEYSKYLKSNLTSLDTLHDVPCLVLLGEPGIGKSNVMDELERSYQEQATQDGAQVEKINLASYGDEQRLFTRIDSAVERARSKTARLYLLLDSLDECPMAHIASSLSDRFSEVPCDNLYLRIACRTFDWLRWTPLSRPRIGV